MKQAIRRSLILALSACAGIGASCASRGTPPPHAAKGDRGGPTPVLFDGMGTHTRVITTSSDQAQRWFNQGLVWAYAFNHDEAIRSFEQAAAADPSCAMAYWGIALCNGPHINNPVVPEARRRAAWEAAEKARSLSATASPVERDLITAVGARYSADFAADRAPLDAAYADAMREVWARYPDDTDVGTLFAESMMDLRPWDLWSLSGEPRPGTPEIVATLERVRTLNPDHPGANHLYIHTVEASNDPGRADDAADRLRHAVPVAGHLVHMPSHIDVRRGRYAQASDANIAAIESDAEYQRLAPRPPDFYRVYMAHNRHFLAFSSMMEGRESAALSAADGLLASVPPAWAKENAPLADPSMGIRTEVLVRFGRWNEVLSQPRPAASFPITTAMWRHARTVALANTGDIAAARREHTAFEGCVAVISAETMVTINPARTVLDIARHKSLGEIALAEGNLEIAIRELAAAVAIEDTLMYMEPPDWILPMRHPLGAVLMKAGRPEDAERVYREDLARWPENGWSLAGLKASLQAQGRPDRAAAVEERLNRAWARADAPIETSCLCVPRLSAK